ncbi:hypothetical protein ACMXYR_05665 [Neptuniibacter sp. QD29_5]
MKQLINELMKLGCEHSKLQVKLSGGGDMIKSMTSIQEATL